MATYDPNVDYSDLIAQEAAKGVNANRQLLAQYEAQRNAKITAERLPYAQTSVYTNELGRPLGYYQAEDRSDYINELYDTAREQARVTAKPGKIENPKYAMRCFLLKLGFIGPEYKETRSVLLSRLPGNGSFKSKK